MSRRTKEVDGGRHDLLQHLVDNGKRPDNGNKMSARDIIDQMAELLLAGSETTSGTLAYDMTLTTTLEMTVQLTLSQLLFPRSGQAPGSAQEARRVTS